jgi:hypothetical protein
MNWTRLLVLVALFVATYLLVLWATCDDLLIAPMILAQTQ